MKRWFTLLLLLLFSSAFAKDNPVVMYWPSQDNAAMRLSFAKFQLFATGKSQGMYLSDVTVENLTTKFIPRIYFDVYVTDKAGVRIGDGVLTISNVGPSQQIKTQVQVVCLGTPAGFSISARKDMMEPKTVPLKILSNPPGAALKVDGQDGGVTPVVVKLTVGTHSLLLNKEGYATSTTPVEIAPDELPGGSITIDLGGLSRDTVELRDGTVVLGDVLSMTLTSVVVRVDGNDKTYDRNLIKKLMLVEHVTTTQQPTTPPTTANPN